MVDDNSSNIIIIDKIGQIQFFNENAQKLLMRNMNGNIPQNFQKMVSKDDLLVFKENLAKCLKSSV